MSPQRPWTLGAWSGMLVACLACGGAGRPSAFDAYCEDVGVAMERSGYDEQTEAVFGLHAEYDPRTPAELAAFALRYEHSEAFVQTYQAFGVASLEMRARLFEMGAVEATGDPQWTCPALHAFWDRDLDGPLLARACDAGSTRACENLAGLEELVDACARGDARCPEAVVPPP